jgi:hypothetical protein
MSGLCSWKTDINLMQIRILKNTNSLNHTSAGEDR